MTDLPLRVLLVEDSADDAELVQRALRAGGLTVDARIVATPAAFDAALRTLSPDLVLADWSLPAFSGAAAVAAAHAWDAGVPCILVSGTLGEELVVEALRTGATDYVLKQRLEALVPAIRRALAEAAEHRDRVRLETELSAAQARADRAERAEMVGRLAGGIAHDFNNLLTVINGYADLLADATPASDPRHEDARAIHDAGRRAAALTRQLLAFGRRLAVERTLVAVDGVVLGLMPMLRSLVGDTVEIVPPAGGAVGVVFVDQSQLEQIIVNLVLNARDAMHGGGRVTIETVDVTVRAGDPTLPASVPPGDYLRLSVSDTGTGIDAKTLAHIFEPFFTTKPRGLGTGLGLSSVEGIVAQMQGFMTVDSEVGKGSTFAVFLPRAAEEAARPTPTPPSTVAVGGGESILLVDDEPDVRAVTARLLRGFGYGVVEAGSPAIAIAIVESGSTRIDMLVVDVVMPDMGGRELAARLAVLLPGLPTLFVSGRAPEWTHLDGFFDQRTNLMAKPFDADELGSRVRALLDGSTAGA